MTFLRNIHISFKLKQAISNIRLRTEHAVRPKNEGEGEREEAFTLSLVLYNNKKSKEKGPSPNISKRWEKEAGERVLKDGRRRRAEVSFSRQTAGAERLLDEKAEARPRAETSALGNRQSMPNRHHHHHRRRRRPLAIARITCASTR